MMRHDCDDGKTIKFLKKKEKLYFYSRGCGGLLNVFLLLNMAIDDKDSILKV